MDRRPRRGVRRDINFINPGGEKRVRTGSKRTVEVAAIVVVVVVAVAARKRRVLS
jgi:hypothetical protein